MPTTPRILALAGSTRHESYNMKLVKIAAAGARAAGAEVSIVDLRDLPLPLFDEDLEATEGLPPNVRRLKELFLAHQGLLIASPEYNSSITPLLKNVIDWVSRPVPGEAPLGCFANKVAALMSASPGALGGLRGLVTVRSILSNIRVWVMPDQVAVPKAHEAFTAEGALKDAGLQAAVEKLGSDLAATIRKLIA